MATNAIALWVDMASGEPRGGMLSMMTIAAFPQQEQIFGSNVSASLARGNGKTFPDVVSG